MFALAAPAQAEDHKEADKVRPKLVVAISIDQLSSDLFSEYRNQFSGGFKRLLTGAVFPSGYQAHAATETCPGHSTILTGAHPARSGIIANGWVDQRISREQKAVYCAEDVNARHAGPPAYVPSAVHLEVPTLGERMKSANPYSRNVSVSGKDRAALTMGGKNTDQVYFFEREVKQFLTVSGRDLHPFMASLNSKVEKQVDDGLANRAVPVFCEAKGREIKVNERKSVGEHDLTRSPGDSYGYRASPDLDAVTLEAATGLVDAMQLGKGAATDMLAIGLSSTDYVGHMYGTQGQEMCIQLLALDNMLGSFFDGLDQRGIDYLVALTADHGGHDLPERLREQGVPEAKRIGDDFNVAGLEKSVGRALGLEDGTPLFYPSRFFNSDIYIMDSLDAGMKQRVKSEAIRQLSDSQQVEAVFDTSTLGNVAISTAAPENWTLAERARASYYPGRSGDILVMLKKATTPIPASTTTYVATHGSPWDYDRRVPMLFWHKDMAHFEQALTVMTVDIAPTLAAMIGLNIAANELDGRCLDLDAGAGDSCN